MHVAIVGPGRLGRSLTVLLRDAGHSVELVGRGARPAKADVTLLAVPDRAIADAAAALGPRRAPVLHCSGAVGLDPLRPHVPAGSFHPLMTFPGPERGLPDLAGVPVALAGHPQAIAVGRALADALGMAPLEVPGDRRLYHAAAVIAGNFATVLLAHAAQALRAAGVPPDRAGEALAPLAMQSIRNAARDPVGSLTGPAARGDVAVLDAHRAALEAAGLLDALQLYDTLTAAAVALRDAPTPNTDSRDGDGAD